jgi:hypothetical protein
MSQLTIKRDDGSILIVNLPERVKPLGKKQENTLLLMFKVVVGLLILSNIVGWIVIKLLEKFIPI